ncbi:hypothetical protein C5L14_02080 [Labrys okinawensis]|uniref:Uncharacterized protein n=1 Tax=Labrys okinawensis TaxID=346911 RepID=A0A2S9QJ57_9HYPH|nr:hypothetical protein C5L14_02080 [Labrys okinawensis]
MTLNVAITRLLSGYDELGSNALEDHRALLENILSRAFFALPALSQENQVISMRLIILGSPFDVESKTFWEARPAIDRNRSSPDDFIDA